MAYKQRSPIAIAEGGTNATTMATTDGVAYYDGTRLVTTAAGTATHVLTSNGAGVAPTFQAAAAGGITTIAGDSGTATGSTVTFSTTELKNATPQFTASGAQVDFNFGDANDNLIISTTAGSGTITSAGGNAGYGNDCFNALTTGSNNVGLGLGAFLSLTSGTNNTGLGQQPGVLLTTGNHNFIAGAYQPGVSYTGSESSNLIIENDGVVGESNTMRIGTTGSGDHQVNRAFIAGVAGVSVSNTQMMTINSSTGQMGSATIPSGVVATIAGNTGTATGSTITFDANDQGTPNFVASGATVSLDFSDSNNNIMVGLSAPSTASGSSNCGFGRLVFQSLVNGDGNASFGNQSMNHLNGGSTNSGIGQSALYSLTTGSNNTALGVNSLLYLLTGSNNLAIGSSDSGSEYLGAESNNILINNDGVLGESNTMRIGDSGSGTAQVNRAFIAGISGVTVTGTAVLCATDGQLGTVASSARYKDNIVDMADNNLMKLRPVNFTYKSDKTNVQQYGLIAEEVEEVFKDLVFYNAEGTPESVHYEKLPAILLHELQKQNKRIAALEAQLAAK